MNLKKNDIVPVSITGMTAEGSGVGRYEDFPIFIPLSAVGDSLRVRILKVNQKFAYGKIEEILTPSEDRIESDCPYFSACGGCCYRHVRYEAELAYKSQKVYDALTRIGGLRNVKLQPIIGTPGRGGYGYRNKALIPLGTGSGGRLEMGFYAVNSHRIVDCEYCRLQPEEFNTAMQVFRRWHGQFPVSIYNEASHSGLLRRLYLRKAESTGEIMVCVVAARDHFPHEEELLAAMRTALPGLTGFIINVNPDKTNVALSRQNRTLWGQDFIRDELCGLQFDISPLSFYQVNRQQAEVLYAKAAEYAALTGSETLLDLYCGTGTIGLSMARRAKKLIGVEVVEAAILNARENARQNHIQNAEFICADAAKAAETLRRRGEAPDVIIVDPPRKGCDPLLLLTIAEMSPDRIVYVSCDPATLARDLKRFVELGYALKEVTPLDMFPCTGHVETVVLMSRVEK